MLLKLVVWLGASAGCGLAAWAWIRTWGGPVEAEARVAPSERARVWRELEWEFMRRGHRGDWRTWDVADEVAQQVGWDIATVFEFCVDHDVRHPVLKLLRERDLRRGTQLP